MIFSVKNWLDTPSTSTPINAAALKDLETRLAEAVENSVIVPKKKFREGHAFVLQGSVTTTSVPGLFVPIASGQESNLVAVRYKLESGTEAKFRVQKNGANITGFGTEGTPLVATPTAATTEPTAVALANNDLLSIVISTVTGSPVGLTVTLYVETIC